VVKRAQKAAGAALSRPTGRVPELAAPLALAFSRRELEARECSGEWARPTRRLTARFAITP